MNDETWSADEIAERITGWWLDVENLEWDREARVVQAPIDLPETRVRLSGWVGTSKAPEYFTYQLVIRPVTDLVVRNDGEYPWAQPVEGVTFDPDVGEMTIELGFGSTLQMRVRAPEVRLDAPNEIT